MKKIFIFCHGWGVDHTFWIPLAKYFTEEQTIYLDLGYFGTTNINDLLKNTNNNIIIGIGHSMGLIKLLNLNVNFTAFIGIQSFINFLGFNQILNQQRKISLQQMEKNFIVNPKATLIAFHKKSKYILNNINLLLQLNTKKLADDLINLYYYYKLPDNIPILILASLNDLIVPTALILDNFTNNPNIKIKIYKSGDHNLLLHHSKDIYKDIQSFLHETIKK